MEKKYQVFISSTYTDLIEERKKVRDTILNMLHFPVGMEVFGAADEEQWEIIKDTIDSSDYYVLIIAHRYGTIISEGPDAGISYTEKEYRYAKEKGVPILAFLMDDSVAVTLDKIDSEHKEELQKFKKDVLGSRLIEYWKTADDLAQKVSISLHKQMDRKKRPGWIRANSFDIEESHAQLLELNRKIQRLESENKSLQDELNACKSQNTREPYLETTLTVDMSNDVLGRFSHPEYAIQDENMSLKGLKILNVSKFNTVKRQYRKITINDFSKDLIPFAIESEIDDYNNSLPTNEELRNYADKLDHYIQITKSCIHVEIGLQNVGTAIANSASLVIQFPDSVEVYNNNIIDLLEPEAPEKGNNPIELAAKRKKYQSSNMLYNNPNILNGLTEKLNLVNPLLYAIEDSKYCLINSNIVEINCDKLIHSYISCKNDVYLVGRKPGKYKIKCSLICEEYEKPVVKYIDFEVVE